MNTNALQAGLALAATASPPLFGMHSYPTKGQQPYINTRGRSDGFLTNRVNVCVGCRTPGGTLRRLTKAIPVYSHVEHLDDSLKILTDFMTAEIERKVNAGVPKAS